MFLTHRTHDLIVKAMNESFGLSISSKHNEIVSLNKLIDRLTEEVKYERARADSLVDRLLLRDAKVAAVAPAAIAAAAERDKVTVEKLKETFAGLAEVGEMPDPGAPGEPRAVEVAGGSVVAR